MADTTVSVKLNAEQLARIIEALRHRQQQTKRGRERMRIGDLLQELADKWRELTGAGF